MIAFGRRGLIWMMVFGGGGGGGGGPCMNDGLWWEGLYKKGTTLIHEYMIDLFTV